MFEGFVGSTAIEGSQIPVLKAGPSWIFTAWAVAVRPANSSAKDRAWVENWRIFTDMKFILVIWFWWAGAVAQDPAVHTKVRHEFYVSVTDFHVDIEKGKITGVVKTFPDDWERAMNALLQEKVMRYVQLDSNQRAALHGQYLEQHIQLNLNGEAMAVEYFGTSRGPDEVYLLFTAEYGDKELEELSGNWSIKHTLLADIYPSQENIVIFHYDGRKQTNSCRESNDYRLNFNF